MKLKEKLLLLVGLGKALEKGLLSLGTYMELCRVLIDDEKDNNKDGY